MRNSLTPLNAEAVQVRVSDRPFAHRDPWVRTKCQWDPEG